VTDVTRPGGPTQIIDPRPVGQLPAPTQGVSPVRTEPDCNGECACGAEPLAHPKYSFGMLLEPSLLALEHRYHALRANTHDIRLHDFGTVCGLRVDKHPSPQCVDTYAILRPGIALDCCGREIVVPQDLFVPLHDGATSGWCGAAMGATASGVALPAETAPEKLYICLRYAQCDTDPIPTYVRACGCCGPCEHGDCTPSVTREGYEVVVTSKRPPDWTNPIGRAFCEWLDVKLKGPGSSAPAQVLHGKTLDEILCAIITEPCADFCSGGNDLLLLATVTLNDKKLTGIDNVTGRRLVIPTGAIAEALVCLTQAEIACCAATDAYLTLSATVAPATINLAAPPAGNALSYTVTVTNTDAHKDSESFEVFLGFSSGGLTFSSATLTIAGATQPATSGSAAGVTAAIPKLVAGGTVQLVVNATFDPAKHSVGDTVVSVASIDEYPGDHDPDVTLTTPFIDQVVDGPRVVSAKLPVGPAETELGNLLREGINIPFTEVMDPASAVATKTETAPGTVTLTLTNVDGVSRLLPSDISWDASNMFLKVSAADSAEFPVGKAVTDTLTITLTAGPKGGTFTGPALRDKTDQTRLDGSPATGGDIAAESGDGTQGGDFVYQIIPTKPTG